MRKERKYNALFILFLAFSISLSAQELSNKSAHTFDNERCATFSVLTTSPGHMVLLGQDTLGVTPIHDMHVPCGKHNLTIKRRQDTSWFTTDWVKTYEISKGDNVIVEPTFSHAFYIQTEPFGASVYVDGERLGETPLVLEFSEELPQKVMLKKSGYFDKELNLNPFGKQFFKIAMDSDDDYWVEYAISEESSKINLKRKKQMLYLSAVAGVASAIGAVMLKDKADDYHSRYEREADPEKMDRYFDKSELYDKYSAVAFGVLQVSFGFSLYYFIKSRPQ